MAISFFSLLNDFLESSRPSGKPALPQPWLSGFEEAPNRASAL
jgi:hypothetical protein